MKEEEAVIVRLGCFNHWFSRPPKVSRAHLAWECWGQGQQRTSRTWNHGTLRAAEDQRVLLRLAKVSRCRGRIIFGRSGRGCRGSLQLVGHWWTAGASTAL